MVFAVVSALGVCWPALYWLFKKNIKLGDSKISCPSCNCDCPPPLSLLKIAPGNPLSLLNMGFLLFWIRFLMFFVSGFQGSGWVPDERDGSHDVSMASD